MTKLVLMLGLLLVSCERSEQRAAPITHARDAAPPVEAGVFTLREGHFRSTNEKPVLPSEMPNLFGQGCTRGVEEPYPQLPYPIGIPSGHLIVTWCRDGAHLFHLDGTKAADGILVQGEPDGDWTYYSERGTRYLAGRYARGKPNGLWRVFDDDGVTTQIGCFELGVKRWGEIGDTAKAACPPTKSR